LIYQTDGVSGFYYFNDVWQQMTPYIYDKANISLSNLSATAINTDLLPGSSGLYDVGSSSFNWKNIYFSGEINLQGNRFISTRGNNSFFGTLAGNPAVTGSYNTATGASALSTNVNGNWNTANGYTALSNTNNAYSNTGTGFEALVANTTGSYNTANGVLALGSNTTGISNSAMGVAALNNLSAGNSNSAIGYFAGANLPTGNYNTYLGSYADGPSGVNVSNATAIGYNAAVTASNSVRVGNTSVTSIGGQVNWTAFSDGRFKKNIKENVPGLDFINKLRAVTYNLDPDGIDKILRPTTAGVENGSDVLGKRREATAEELKAKQDKSTIKYTGFIAQEVQETAKKLNYDFSGVDVPKNSKDFYGLRYGDFVVPLVKAVQELSSENSLLKDDLATLKNSNENLANQVAELSEMVAKVLNAKASTSASLTNISLDQNNPNPFATTTRVSYSVPGRYKKALLLITDPAGKTIKEISLPVATNASVNIDASFISAGSYTYTIVADGQKIQSKKMIVAK
jgi:hypothetical protein